MGVGEWSAGTVLVRVSGGLGLDYSGISLSLVVVRGVEWVGLLVRGLNMDSRIYGIFGG